MRKSLVFISAITILLSSSYFISDSFAEVISIPEGTSSPGCENHNSCYLPNSITISKGKTITWNNDDTAAHTVTAGSPTKGVQVEIFDSSLLMAGSSFSVTLDDAGEYPYFCMVHPWMQGIVRVTEVTSLESPETKVTSLESPQTTGTQKVTVTTKTIKNPELETVSSLQQKISKVLNNADYTLDGPTVILLEDGSKKSGYTIINPEGDSFGAVNIWSKDNYVIELELGTTHNNDFESAGISAIVLAGLIKAVIDPNEYGIDDFTEMYADAAEDLDYETDSIRTTPNGSKIKVGYITILEGIPGLTVVTFDIKYKQYITVSDTKVSEDPPVVNTPKIESTSTVKNEKIEYTRNASESDSGNAALGAFIVFGIPAILIGLFILRRKMKKIKIQKIKDAEWGGV